MIRELVRQEAIKLFAQRYPYLLLAAVLALQTLRMLLLVLGTPATSLDVVTAPQVWAEGLGWALRMLVFVVLVVGAMAFSREFSLGTAKMILVLPVRRRDWLLAKLVSLVGLTWALLAVCAVLGLALVAVAPGWGAVVREGIVLYPAAEATRHLLTALGLTALYVLPLCAFALGVGLLFNNSGAAVGVAVLLGSALESVGGLLDAGRYVFIFHVHQPFAHLVRMGKGLPFSWHDALTVGLPVALGWFLALLALTWWRLERMDLQG